MAYLQGERVKANFFDAQGNIIRQLDQICFASWFGYYHGEVQKNTVKIELWFTLEAPKNYYEYFVAKMSVMGVYDNIKAEVLDDRIMLHIDPAKVTAQEVFWVGKVTRLVTGTPDVLYSFLHLCENTSFPADLCLLLAHFVRASKDRCGGFEAYDHNLLGAAGYTKFTNRFTKVLKKLREEGVLFNRANEFALKDGRYFNQLFYSLGADYLFNDELVVFTEEKDLLGYFDEKEYLCD